MCYKLMLPYKLSFYEYINACRYVNICNTIVIYHFLLLFDRSTFPSILVSKSLEEKQALVDYSFILFFFLFIYLFYVLSRDRSWSKCQGPHKTPGYTTVTQTQRAQAGSMSPPQLSSRIHELLQAQVSSQPFPCVSAS